MNHAQALWCTQARSDFSIFVHLRRAGAHECHLLHYLQMSTEKLSKAYLWRSGHAPPKKHTGFIRFLKALLDRRSADLERVSKTLGFGRPEDLDKWVSSPSIQTLAYWLQDLAPAIAIDRPNPEYPWPHGAPTECPAEHSFALWNRLSDSGQGRKMIEFIERAIIRFDAYA